MTHIHILARAPVVGHCKTRLIPRLGAHGAAWVQRRLIEHVLTVAIKSVGVNNITLWGAPDATHGFFSLCRQRYGVRLARQSQGDLGTRIRSSLQKKPGLLIGSDALGLTPEDLLRAQAAMAETDYLLLGAPDGGYVLIGANKPLPHLAGISWSSGREGRQTSARLARVGRMIWLAPARNDLDTAADWRNARRQDRLPPLIHQQKFASNRLSGRSRLPFGAEA